MAGADAPPDPARASAGCALTSPPGLSRLTVVRLDPQPPPADHATALALAHKQAASRLEAPMLLSWFDRDRNLESPRHASECHQAGATPGYADYALNREAVLMVDIGQGRFVFFYRSGAR